MNTIRRKETDQIGAATTPRRIWRPIGLGVVVLAVTLAMASCKDDSEPTGSTSVPVVNMVVVGDSLSAGTQNSCLLASQQENSYTNVIAKQAGYALKLPLVTGPGSPACLDILETNNILTVQKFIGFDGTGAPLPADNPADWGVRVDPTFQPTNLGVPGTRVVDAAVPGYVDHTKVFFDLLAYPYNYTRELVLNTPVQDPITSMLDQAEVLLNASDADTDFVIFWLGSNDALWPAVAGSDLLLTPQTDFKAAYEGAMDRLAAGGATIVTANVPNTTVIPHLIPAREALLMFDPAITSTNVDDVMLAMGVADGDYITLGGLGGVYASIVNFSTKGSFLVLADNHVTTAAEIANIQAAIVGYNTIIKDTAAAYGAVHVDINALLDDVDANDYTIGSTVITTNYCGGVFSLDGIHPTNTGYAIVANTFIDAIGSQTGVWIPKADVAEALANEPQKHSCIGPLDRTD